MRKPFLLLAVLLALSGCDHGNVKPVASYSAPPAPPIRNPTFMPYAPYGDANATWEPPTFNQDGTIVKPTEPSSQATLRIRAMGNRSRGRQPKRATGHVLTKNEHRDSHFDPTR